MVTLCNGIIPALLAAAIGSPLFALWVLIDYRHTLRSSEPAATSASDGGLA
jgi:hypothetical protein